MTAPAYQVIDRTGRTGPYMPLVVDVLVDGDANTPRKKGAEAFRASFHIVPEPRSPQ